MDSGEFPLPHVPLHAVHPLHHKFLKVVAVWGMCHVTHSVIELEKFQRGSVVL